MNRTFFHPLAGTLFGLALACTSAGTVANSASVAVQPWTPAAKTTPTLAQCRTAAEPNGTPCYQTYLTSVLKTQGMDSAMAVLTRLATTEKPVRDNNHMYAHMLGLAAFTTPAELANVFSRCSPGFQSGCYHGVIQAYFVDQNRKSPGAEPVASQINALCADFRGGAQQWLLFQCAHGLGHGLEFIYAHDLPRALAGCDAVSDSWERPACYGGAFMENIVSVTNPHQTAEGMTEEMGMDHDMAGMDMSKMDHSAHESGFKKFDPADPHYPCSALDDRYGEQCYLIQTSLMLFENHGDFAAAAKSCLAAPEKHRVSCFVSLGRDANSYAGSNAERASRSCALAPQDFQPWCHVGVTKNLVDISTRPADGFAYCSILRDNVSKVTCYSAVGEEIRFLSADVARRKEMCALAPSPFDGACLYGAGVVATPPPGMVPR